MPLGRQEVLELLSDERDYQALAWPANETDNRTEHCMELIRGYVNKANDAWLSSKDEVPVWQQLAKIGAIVVRGLEFGKGTEKLYNEGLR